MDKQSFTQQPRPAKGPAHVMQSPQPQLNAGGMSNQERYRDDCPALGRGSRFRGQHARCCIGPFRVWGIRGSLKRRSVKRSWRFCDGVRRVTSLIDTNCAPTQPGRLPSYMRVSAGETKTMHMIYTPTPWTPAMKHEAKDGDGVGKTGSACTD